MPVGKITNSPLGLNDKRRKKEEIISSKNIICDLGWRAFYSNSSLRIEFYTFVEVGESGELAFVGEFISISSLDSVKDLLTGELSGAELVSVGSLV